MTDNIKKFQQLIDESKSIVFFGGAGVSTESNIPDFRSDDGIYNKKFDYPPEVMLSHSFYKNHTEEFFDFYRTMLFPNAQPNPAHLKLAQWEKEHKLKAIVTQNIDGLHQKAGSKNVYELHGSVKRNYCEKCHQFYDENAVLSCKGVPLCHCGGTIKPDVVLYEEGLDNQVINGAVQAIKNADMLIVGGTSLVVYPAAGLITYYTGNKLVLINRDSTSYDSKADLIFHDKIGEVLSQLK
ncbi:MAG: NAD-dependent protein deacylase [Clostridiales bacterium]